MKRVGWGVPGGETILLVGWSAIAFGGAITDGHYSDRGIVLVTIGTLVLLFVALGGVTFIGRWTRYAGAVALITADLGALVLPAGAYGVGASLFLSRGLTLAAAVTVSAWWWWGKEHFIPVAYVSIAVMVGAGVAMIVSSPKPPIDVWYSLQAAAHGLTHDQNIYTLKWTSGVAGEFSNGFAYLPGSAVMLWPFHAAFGDVRYGLVAAMAVTALLMVRFGRRGLGTVAGCLVLLYPRALFGVEQSWVDPLVLVSLCAMVVAVAKQRRGWAVVAFAVCLTCKQQAWILLPLAALWNDFGWKRSLASAGGAVAFIAPWILTAPHAFYRGAVSYNLFLPAWSRSNSLSLYAVFLRSGWNPGTVFTALATAVAIVLCGVRLPKDAFGFCLGAAVVEAVFNLTSKQPYFNEWELAAGLALMAVAFGPVRTHDDGGPVTGRTTAGGDPADKAAAVAR
jgi:hypothetical protein